MPSVRCRAAASVLLRCASRTDGVGLPTDAVCQHRPARARRAGAGTSRAAPNAAFAPISAADFFAGANAVGVGALDARVYYTPPADGSAGAGAVLVCHHGAGYSGLSFAAFAREVRDMTKGELGVLAMDARRHGTCIVGGVESGSRPAQARPLARRMTLTSRSTCSPPIWSRF
jgi:hypothetical protein